MCDALKHIKERCTCGTMEQGWKRANAISDGRQKISITSVVVHSYFSGACRGSIISPLLRLQTHLIVDNWEGRKKKAILPFLTIRKLVFHCSLFGGIKRIKKKKSPWSKNLWWDGAEITKSTSFRWMSIELHYRSRQEPGSKIQNSLEDSDAFQMRLIFILYNVVIEKKLFRKDYKNLLFFF